MLNDIKINENKISFNQCKKMIKALNSNAMINNIPIKLDIQKRLIQDSEDIKYALLVFNLNTNENKIHAEFNLNELHEHLLKGFTKI